MPFKYYLGGICLFRSLNFFDIVHILFAVFFSGEVLQQDSLSRAKGILFVRRVQPDIRAFQAINKYGIVRS